MREKVRIQIIAQIYKKHRLALDTTIYNLLVSNGTYPLGSITTIVIGFQQKSKQVELNIKDGKTLGDNAIVSLLRK